MAEPISYYFTLFKKFQVCNHVPEATGHGGPGGLGGFNLNDPNSVFGSALDGALLGATTTPSDSPLWAILNSRAMGNAAFTPVSVGGTSWPTMPADPLPQAWNDLQVTPSTKLVDVFGDWITAGKTNDIPAGVLGKVPPSPIPSPDPGVGLFVCSMANDLGIRPDGVPGDYWAKSLIYLVDPKSGNTVNPVTLTGNTEYYLAAVIGNRGNTGAGIYNYALPTAEQVGIEVAASVMVWNTFDSPGVELPALSNLDVNDTNGIYSQYFLQAASYDVVGFRLNVQTVFDGVIAALTQAANDGLDLGNLSPEQWVFTKPAHLCSKVVIREQGGAFPDYGTDFPTSNPRIAQMNLARFDLSLTVSTLDPNIIWKNFIVGQPLFFRIPGAGRNRLTLQARLPHQSFRLYLGVPKDTFARYFAEGRGGSFKGFRPIPPQELRESRLDERAKPFPEAVVLEYLGGENLLEIPPLPEGQYLGMSLGLEYSVKRTRPGTTFDINLVHRTLLPQLVPGTRCFEIEEATVGGFTLVVRAPELRQRPG